MNQDNTPSEASWAEMAPQLDEAMTRLNEADRIALLLRFFQGKSFQQVGQALAMSEDAARMRVNRALEKLRQLLKGKAALYPAATLGALLMENASEAVPDASITAIKVAALEVARVASIPSGVLGLLASLSKSPMGVAIVAGMAILTVITLNFHAKTPPSESARAANSRTQIQVDGSALQPTPKSTRLRQFNTSVKTEDPRSAAAREFYEQGNAHRHQMKYDEALVDFSKAIELIEQGLPREPWFSDAYFARACLYDGHPQEAKRDYVKAIADYTRELELEPKMYSPLFNRSLDYTHVKRYEEAIAGFTQILTDPDTNFSRNGDGRTNCLARTYQYRADAKSRNKDYEGAIQDYTESLSLDPLGNEGVVYFHRGWCYRKLGRAEKLQEEADQMSDMAIKMATAPAAKDSDRSRALSIARWASEIMDHKSRYQLEAYAAVYAQDGKFSNAVYEQTRAIDLADQTTESERQAMQARLELYRSGRTLH